MTLETVQALSIKFAVKLVRLKVDIIYASSVILTFTQGHNCVANWTLILTCSLIVISQTILRYGIQSWHDGRLMHGVIIMLILISMTLTLMQGF